MAHRHRAQRAKGGRMAFEEEGHKIEHEAGMKRGGRHHKAGGRAKEVFAFGGAAKGRPDRRAKGGGIKSSSPFSAAAKGFASGGKVGANTHPFTTATRSDDHKRTTHTHGGKHQPRKDGGRTGFSRGGRPEAGYEHDGTVHGIHAGTGAHEEKNELHGMGRAGHPEHHAHRAAGGRLKAKAAGGEVSFKRKDGGTVTFKTGGAVPKPKRHGGECEHDDDDE